MCMHANDHEKSWLVQTLRELNTRGVTVGVVVKIISTGLMAPINFSAITFIPGMKFTFGSFNFITGVNGRLHVSNLEVTSIGQM